MQEQRKQITRLVQGGGGEGWEVAVLLIRDGRRARGENVVRRDR